MIKCAQNVLANSLHHTLIIAVSAMNMDAANIYIYIRHTSFFDKTCIYNPVQFLSASPELVWDAGDVSGRRRKRKQNNW